MLSGASTATAIAVGLAGVIADPAMHRRHRIVGNQDFPRLPVVAGLNLGQPGRGMSSPAGQAALQGGVSVT